MNRYALRILSSLIILLVPLSSSAVRAQSIWLPPSEDNQISLEIFKAQYESGVPDVSFGSTTWFLSGRFRVGSFSTIVAELPISHANFDGNFSPGAETAVGNPYIGGVVKRPGSSVIAEAGVRLPVVSEDNEEARFNGSYSEFDRWEAFLADLLTVRVRMGTDITSPSDGANLVTRFRLGGTFWIPTEDGDGEAFIDGVIGLWLRPAQISLGVTLSGRTLVSEGDLSFNERSEFQLGLDAQANFGRVRPGVHLHVPLANESLIGVGSVVSTVIGVNVTVLLPEAGAP